VKGQQTTKSSEGRQGPVPLLFVFAVRRTGMHRPSGGDVADHQRYARGFVIHRCVEYSCLDDERPRTTLLQYSLRDVSLSMSASPSICDTGHCSEPTSTMYVMSHSLRLHC